MNESSTDLIDRLHVLGQAAEDLVEPVTAVEVLGTRVPAAESRSRRRGVALGAVAAVAGLVGLWLGAGFVADIGQREPVVLVATAPDGGESGAVEQPTEFTEPARLEPDELSGAEIRAQWEQLRQCESRGDYASNTGNGFYGAYQFDETSWQTVGGLGLPSDAPPIVQDEAASRLFRQVGSEPWPVCGRFVTEAATSPVVSSWIIESRRTDDFAIFFTVDATEADIGRVSAIVQRSALFADKHETDTTGSVLTFVDKDAALSEFRELFEDSPDLTANVDASELPPSLRVALSPAPVNGLDAHRRDTEENFRNYVHLREQLDADPAVMRVVAGRAESVFPPGWSVFPPGWSVSPAWLEVSSFLVKITSEGGLWEPGWTARVDDASELSLATIADAVDGLVSYQVGGDRTVITGHGVHPEDPFFGLAELVPGDTISLSASAESDGTRWEWIVESTEIVDAMTAPLPAERTLSLTSEGDSPDTRRVVTALPVETMSIFDGGS